MKTRYVYSGPICLAIILTFSAVARADLWFGSDSGNIGYEGGVEPLSATFGVSDVTLFAKTNIGGSVFYTYTNISSLGRLIRAEFQSGPFVVKRMPAPYDTVDWAWYFADGGTITVRGSIRDLPEDTLLAQGLFVTGFSGGIFGGPIPGTAIMAAEWQKVLGRMVLSGGIHWTYLNPMIGRLDLNEEGSFSGLVENLTYGTNDSFSANIEDVGYCYFYVRTTAGAYIAGDINQDGMLDMKDFVIAMKLTVGQRSPTPEELSACDFNGNGIVDKDDAQIILRLIKDSRN